METIMYVVTLLTSPVDHDLDRNLVENLRNAWGGGDAVWLSPDEAAEFAIAELPNNLSTVWDDLQALRTDLVVQPAGGRRKDMLLADMDSTMIQQECIDQLAAAAGVGDQVAGITALAMNGSLDFEAALRERVALLKDSETSLIDTVYKASITLMPGARTLVSTMKASGAYTALVSGGFTDFSERVAGVLGFDEHRANILLSAGGRLTGKVAEPILGRDAKVKSLQEISARQGIAIDQVMAVGDGANDLGMLQLAGAGVALHAKPVVAAACDMRINFGDLTALLYLQGYSHDDFVN